MTPPNPPVPPVAPIFIIADDDRSALDRLMALLDSERFYVPIWQTRLIVRNAKHCATTAVFLADDIEYPEGGTARLLQQLLDQVGKPVIIMAEEWAPETVVRWKRMGASDCIPHPTRSEQRMEYFRAKLQELSLGAVSGASEARAVEPSKE